MRHARINVVTIVASCVARSPGTPDPRKSRDDVASRISHAIVEPFDAAMRKVTLLPYFPLAWPRCRPKAATKRDANPHDVQCGGLSNEAALFCDFDDSV